MTPRPARADDAGVSLIEVLVSLAIFAIIGVAGLAVLDTVSRTGERTDGRLERLSDIDRGFLLLRRDLMQMDGLSARLNRGALQFRRPSEERFVFLTYLADDDAFQRRIEVATNEPIGQRLIEKTLSADWQLMDGTGRWHSAWPPRGAPQRPHAAELSLSLRTGNGRSEKVTRLFPLAAGQGQ